MSTALFDLTGRTALVTGSSRGLGRAIAEGLTAAGATVVLNGAILPGWRAPVPTCARLAIWCTRPALT